MRCGHRRLGAIDPSTHAVESNPLGLRTPYARGEKFVGEIRHPRQRAAVRCDDPQERARIGHPVERAQGADRNAGHRRNDRARDQTHVLIQRQPGPNPIRRRPVQACGVVCYLAQHGPIRERDALLESRAPGRVLQQHDVLGCDLGMRNRDVLRRQPVGDGSSLGRFARRPAPRHAAVSVSVTTTCASIRVRSAAISCW